MMDMTHRKGRTCASCWMCCTAMNISERGTIPEPYEFTKRPGSKCPHENRGCTLHGTNKKPWSCATYECMWLMGEGTEEMKPNISKLIASLEERQFTDELPKEMYLVLYECRPGAVDTSAADAWYRWVLQSPHVVGIEVIPYGPALTTHHKVFHKERGKFDFGVFDWPPPVDQDAERIAVMRFLGRDPYKDSPPGSTLEVILEAKRLGLSHQRIYEFIKNEWPTSEPK